MMIIGIDTGGTFTDVVLFDGEQMRTYKLSSTPNDFAEAVLAGAKALRGKDRFDLVHSTTVATNALLERKGARTALITTRGFRDVLQIGRQARSELYNFNVEQVEPLVTRELRFEVEERVDAEGKVVKALDERQLDKLMHRIKAKGATSLAVCLLFSFLRPAHEKKIEAAAKRAGLPVSISSRVLPEFREFERTTTTVVNAYVSPVMKDYLDRLQKKAKIMGAENIRIVQQNGGCMSTRAAGSHAVSALLSGPAAGVIAAWRIARQSFQRNHVKLITFDMGGTSTDVALLDGNIQVTSEAQIGGLPIGVPMMDIHTVGAGGGSLAYADFGGGLQVGPESAGADPGPACYGRGEQPAVTDANLFLGRLQAEYFLNGRFKPDFARSKKAIGNLARQLGATPKRTAEGIVRLVNAHMEQAIRVISVERGHDPREFTLVSFGGAGGLHACAVARSLRIPQVLIPVNAGVISALGCVCTDVVKEASRTLMKPLEEKYRSAIDKVFDALLVQLRREMQRDGVLPSACQFKMSVDVRYRGQSFEFGVEWGETMTVVAAAFHEKHAFRYGHAHEEATIEVVNVRVSAVAETAKPELQPIAKGRKSVVHPEGGVLHRDQLKAGNRLVGPVIIVEDYSTTLLEAGWIATVDEWGNIIAEDTSS